MENTLEERVDQLIAKSSQEPPPNQRGNRNNHSFDGAPYMYNQKSKRNPNLNFQEPQNDTHQHLQGPDPSAARPFDESDGSRMIQCFRCRGWGHPRRLCPSQLNYTGGGAIQGPPSPKEDRQPGNLPPSNLSPQQ